MTATFKKLFQFAVFLASIFSPVTFAGKISLEDEGVDIRKFKDFSLRVRPRHQRSHESKEDGEKLHEVGCSLYPEVVQVETAGTFVRNRPEFVMVNRCKGACDLPLNSQKCSPTQWKNIPVQVTSDDGRQYHRFVTEHLECGCKCQMSCIENHYMDEKNCRCNCIEKCKEDENQDPTTCTCAPKARKQRGKISINRVLIN